MITHVTSLGFMRTVSFLPSSVGPWADPAKVSVPVVAPGAVGVW
jgi:hypothetical protein